MPGLMWLQLAVAASPSPAKAETIDLLAAPTSCTASPSTKTGEVVVCGRKDSRSPYRLPIPDANKDRPGFKPEVDLGGVKAAAALEQVAIGSGQISQRIMLHLKVPF